MTYALMVSSVVLYLNNCTVLNEVTPSRSQDGAVTITLRLLALITENSKSGTQGCWSKLRKEPCLPGLVPAPGAAKIKRTLKNEA